MSFANLHTHYAHKSVSGWVWRKFINRVCGIPMACRRVCLDPKTAARLAELSRATGRPPSEILEEAVRLYAALLKRGYLHIVWGMARGVEAPA